MPDVQEEETKDLGDDTEALFEENIPEELQEEQEPEDLEAEVLDLDNELEEAEDEIDE